MVPSPIESFNSDPDAGEAGRGRLPRPPGRLARGHRVRGQKRSPTKARELQSYSKLFGARSRLYRYQRLQVIVLNTSKYQAETWDRFLSKVALRKRAADAHNDWARVAFRAARPAAGRRTSGPPALAEKRRQTAGPRT